MYLHDCPLQEALVTSRPNIMSRDGTVCLNHLPLFVHVKLDCTRTSPLLTLPRPLCYPGGSVKQRQYPMTNAYAFTDYWVQEQTIPHIIVDIAKPPSGSLNLFNLYVALSRSSGWGTIRLLAEDDRLLLLDTETAAWWNGMVSPRGV